MRIDDEVWFSYVTSACYTITQLSVKQEFNGPVADFVHAADPAGSELVKLTSLGRASLFMQRLRRTRCSRLFRRFEYYDDSDGGFTTGTAQKLKEFTLIVEVKHAQGLIVRVEYRRDWSNVDFFSKGTSQRNDQNTLSVGWIYAFSSRQ